MATSLGTAYIQVRGDLSQLNKQLVANLHPSRLGKMGKVAGVAVGAGLAGALAGKALFDLGSQFDEQFDKIRVGTGATGQALEGLQEDFKAVAKSTPADFGSIGDAVTGLNQRLNLTGKPLQTLAKQITELSRITGTSVQENVATITRLFGDWGIQTGKQSSQLDKLFRVTQRTGIPLARLSDLMVQFGAPLRQLGFGFDEAATMFGKFEKEGVNLQTILPGFRFALKNLSAPSGEAADALKKLGIAAKDPKVALQEVMAAIKDAPSNLKANAIAFAIFGKRAGPDMAAAIREGRFEYDGLLNQIRTGRDTIKKAGKDTRDFGEEWQLLKNQLAVTLEPIASDFFEAIGDGLVFLRTHKDTVRQFATVMGVLTAAFVAYKAAVLAATAALHLHMAASGKAALVKAVAPAAIGAAAAPAATTVAGGAAGGAATGTAAARIAPHVARVRLVLTSTGLAASIAAILAPVFKKIDASISDHFGNKGGLAGKVFREVFTKALPDSFALEGPVGKKIGPLAKKIRDLFIGGPNLSERLAAKTADAYKAQGRAADEARTATDRLREAVGDSGTSLAPVLTAQRRVNDLRSQGKAGTHAYAEALRSLDAAEGTRLRALAQRTTLESKAKQAAQANVDAAAKALRLARRETTNASALAPFVHRLAQARSAEHAALINVTRATRGLNAISGPTQTKMGVLLKQVRGLAGAPALKKFLVSVDLSSANAAIRLVGKLQDMGRVKTALKIIADAKSPEQALERLRKKLRDLEDRRHRFLVEMRDEATLRLDRLIRKVGDLPRGKITVDVVGGRMSVATKLERALADALTRIGQGQAGKAFKIRPQRGGMIPGTGEGDKVPALLEPGEGVINKKAVRAMGGSQVINRINRRVPRFQRGGFVRPVSASSLPHQRAGKEQSDVEANYHDQRSQRNLLERHGSILRLARTLGIPAFATGGVVRREPISPTAKIVKTGDRYAVVDGKQVVRVVDSLRDIDRSRTDSSSIQSIRDIRDATLREAVTKAATERSTSKDTSGIVDRSAIHTTAEKALSRFAQVRDVATSSLREAITDRHDSRVSRDTLRDTSRTKESALRETLKGGLVERTSERGSASLVERLRASSVTDRTHVSERVSSVLRAVGESVRTSAQDRRTFRETVQELTGRPTSDAARQPGHVPVLSKFAEVRTTLSGRGHGRLGIASHLSGGQGGGLAAHADPRPESTEATHRVANIASNIFESVRSRLSTDQRIQAFRIGGTVGSPALAPVIVGEEGPELAELPVGTRVHSHPVSKRIAKGLGIQAFAKGGVVKAIPPTAQIVKADDKFVVMDGKEVIRVVDSLRDLHRETTRSTMRDTRSATHRADRQDTQVTQRSTDSRTDTRSRVRDISEIRDRAQRKIITDAVRESSLRETTSSSSSLLESVRSTVKARALKRDARFERGADSNDPGRRLARASSQGIGSVTPSEVTQITQRWGVNRAVASIAAAVEDKFPAMQIISGFRSGATTKSGSRSNHAVRAALDLGSRGSLNRRIGSWVRGNFSNSVRGVSEGVLDIDHDPNPPDHADHVHVAALGSQAIGKVMQQGADGGGITRPRRFKKLTLGQYVTVAKQVGFPDPALAAAIFYAESRGDVNAVGDSGQSMGAAQIHLPSHPRLAKQKDKLRDDIFFNFREAKKIARGGRDFSPWTQFRNGAYKPFLGGRAQKLPKGGKGAPPSGSSLADYWAFWQDEATETPGLKDDYKWINKQMSYWRGVLRRNRASNPTRAKDARGNIRQLREDKKALRPEIPDDAFKLGDLAFIGKDVVVPPGKRFPGSGPPPSRDHTWNGTRWVKEAVLKSRRVNIGGIQKTLDRIDLDIAAAGLTETFDGNGNVTPASYADDIKAATEFVNVWTGVKQLAFGEGQSLTSGTIKQKIEAATELKTARDALKSVQDEAKSEEVPLPEAKTDLSAVFAEIAEIMRLYAPNFRALPRFAKGGTLGRTAEALVGEQGREIAEVPVSGARKALTVLGQSGPEIRPLPVGTRIYSHPESKRIAQDLGFQAFAGGGTVRPDAIVAPRDKVEVVVKQEGDKARRPDVVQHLHFVSPPEDQHTVQKAALWELRSSV